MLKLTNLFTNLLKRSAARPFAGWLGGSGARNAPILSPPSSSAMSPLRREPLSPDHRIANVESGAALSPLFDLLTV